MIIHFYDRWLSLILANSVLLFRCASVSILKMGREGLFLLTLLFALQPSSRRTSMWRIETKKAFCGCSTIQGLENRRSRTPWNETACVFHSREANMHLWPLQRHAGSKVLQIQGTHQIIAAKKQTIESRVTQCSRWSHSCTRASATPVSGIALSRVPPQTRWGHRLNVMIAIAGSAMHAQIPTWIN